MAASTKPNTTMKNWKDITHFAGLDWAKDHHDIIVLDAQGGIVADFRIEHSAAGWHDWQERIQAFPGLAVAIETRQGAAIEKLMASGVAVYPVHPTSAQRYRDRKVPSGNKTDRVDAWSLADALRLDGQHWKLLLPEDPLTQRLRILCRDEVGLIGQRSMFVTQLRQALREYYPTALNAFTDWTSPNVWAFIEQFPTPQVLTAAGKRRWNHFLRTHQFFRTDTYQQRMECFTRACEFCGPPAVTDAKSQLALALVRLLKTIQTQLDGYRQQIETLFAAHPDHALFASLPGAGEKLAPRLLSEIGTQRELFTTAQALQCYAGTAPISYQSGQIFKVHLRRSCNKFLRTAVHLWSDLSRHQSVWAQTYYQQLRQRGKSHACALRCLGQRWLKIIWKMWQSHTPYDSELHARNQLKHGSWVLQLNPKPSTNKNAS